MFVNSLVNLLINGGFNFWQRGTTFTSVADSAYTADRWKYKKSGTMVHTISRSTDVPASAVTPYSLLATVTTAQASLGTTGLCYLQQLVEGNFSYKIYGKKICLSFWVKASKTGTYSVRIANSAKDRVLVKSFTVNSASTWEQKTIRLSHSITGTWNKDTSIGLELSFILGAGSNYNTATDGTWVASDLYAVPTQVNGLDTIGNTFQLAEVVLVEDNNGQTRVPNFVMAGRNYLDELLLAQRYFEKSYELDVAPGTAGASGRIGINAGDATNALPPVRFSTIKRSTPVVVLYNQGTGTSGQIRRFTGSSTLAGVASAPSNSTTGDITATVVAGALYDLHFTSDAEL